MEPSRIVIAGGTGSVGKVLRAHFAEQGREVVVLSRREGPGLTQWDGKTHGFWANVLEGAEAVINLSGTPITGRWTERNKRVYEDSRVLPTVAIGEAVRKAQSPPRVWINASAVGFYGDTGSREVSEATRAGTGFMGELCSKWEDACLSQTTLGTRKVCLRLGVVLHREAEFVRATTLMAKVGLGSALGNGRQYISWIHWHDLAKMAEWCLYEPVSGPLNACSPHPETNAEYMAALRKSFGRPRVPSVPAPLVRLGASLMGKEPDLLLTGQRAVPEIALARGFRFRFPELQAALDDVLKVVPPAWRTGLQQGLW
jgi:uncharacterized protein (TIGR01777 family)